MKVTIILAVFSIASCPFSRRTEAADLASPARARPTFGAIRWDGWFQDNPWQRNLDPNQWHDRVPFCGKVISESRVEVCGDSQEAMDREIAYAKAAGLDYWAFLHYHPARSIGRRATARS